jgi:branched-chain amino acid transport system permease protein
MNWAQLLVDGLSTGVVYMMLALGISVVFSVMGLVNFAYGMQIVWFGFMLSTLAGLGMPYWLAVLAALALSVILSLVLARTIFLPFVGAPPATLLLASFGVSIILQSLAVVIFGDIARAVPTPAILLHSLDTGLFRISVLQIVSIVLGLSMLLSLEALINRTRIGIQIRAAAESPDVTRLMGVRSDRVLTFVFGLSGLIAGLVALIWFAQLGSVTARGDLNPTLKAFVAVVIGGLGTVRGAVIGGLLLGFLETAMSGLLVGVMSGFQQTTVFVLVILILLIKPDGIVGKAVGGTR